MYASFFIQLVAGLLSIFLHPARTQGQINPFLPPWTNDPANSGTVKGETFGGKPVYFNGPYRFWGCTEAQGRGLIRTFAHVGYVLRKRVIPDSKRGSYSTYGFSTWFSTNDKAKIIEVFTKINQGYVEPFTSVDDTNARQHIPDFGCFDSTNEDVSLADRTAVAAICNKGVMGFTLQDANLIWLCPRFFADTQQAPALPDILSHSQCQPLNVRGTKFAGPRPNRFYFSKMMIIVSTLATKYMPLGPRIEETDMSDLAALPPERQLVSEKNYALYAQCKSPQASSFLTISSAPFPHTGLLKE